MVSTCDGAMEAAEVSRGKARRGGDRPDGKAKRRKVESVGISPTYMQLRSRRILRTNLVSRRKVSLDRRSENPSFIYDGGVSSSSCCSGDKWNVQKERVSDIETSTFGSETMLFMQRNSSSTIKSTDGKDLTVKVSDSESRMAPTEEELEDFFLTAENQHREKFTEKYNFDLLKEKPLQGRYEWVKL